MQGGTTKNGADFGSPLRGRPVQSLGFGGGPGFPLALHTRCRQPVAGGGHFVMEKTGGASTVSVSLPAFAEKNFWETGSKRHFHRYRRDRSKKLIRPPVLLLIDPFTEPGMSRKQAIAAA